MKLSIAARRLLLGLVVVAMTATPVLGAIVGYQARPLLDDSYVLLVMGSDMGPWRPKTVFDGRSDALHLISVVPSQQTASILSFPRDTYVPVPGLGTTRINSALTRGPERAVETVEALTGIDIDDWIVTGLFPFVLAIDAYGGLDADVPQRLRVDANILEPGPQRLDGTGVLVYTRDRKSRSDGDFGRNRAQAEVLSLLHADIVERQPSAMQLADIFATLRRHTISSIPAGRLPVLAAVALDVDPAKVYRQQVPGSNANRGGAAVVVLDDGAETLFADLRDDGIFTRE
jgi:LCP family protein required for cell wall assembly